MSSTVKSPTAMANVKSALVSVTDGVATIQLPLTQLISKIDTACPEAIPVTVASSLILSTAHATYNSNKNTRRREEPPTPPEPAMESPPPSAMTSFRNGAKVVGDIGEHAVRAVIRANVDAVGTIALDHAVSKCREIEGDFDFGKMTDYLGLHMANRLLFGFVDVAAGIGLEDSSYLDPAVFGVHGLEILSTLGIHAIQVYLSQPK